MACRADLKKTKQKQTNNKKITSKENKLQLLTMPQRVDANFIVNVIWPVNKKSID